MQRSLWLRRSAAVTALALTLGACAGDGDESTDPGTEASDDTTSDEPTDAMDDDSEEPMAMHEADGVFQLGYILPETGQLAFLGPPQIQAVQYAVSLANEAGGVLGSEVTLATGDEAGDAAIASQTASRLLGEGVDAVVGAASSGMSLSFIDSLTGAGVMQCSASNTSPTFTNYNDGGYYFRTAPTDALQGPVLAETVVNDGNTNVAILARADDYGQGLLAATTAALEEQGATVTGVTYDPEAASFSAEVETVSNVADLDAVVLISFDEGAQILKELIEAGFGPADLSVYGADGLRSNTLWEKVNPEDESVLDGMKGTAPDPSADEGFLADLQAFAPDLEETIFAAQAYDCANLLMLAAVAAGTDAGSEVAQAVIDVSREGTECSSFSECVALLDAGEDINYQGASGSVDFVDAGEPDSGVYEVWQIGADGQVTTLDTVESSLS